MTNYFVPLACVALMVSSACADDKSSTAAKPVAAKPAATAAGAPASYVQTTGSSLTFTFEQAGAENRGTFKQFATVLNYDEKNLAASTLSVKVQIASLDTQDNDRDTTLASAELFDTQKFPAATYAANSLVREANGLVALGKLTLRGVTKDLRVPLAVHTTATGLELSGEVTIKRLDYGVGQGEWKSTESVGDAVKLQYKVMLVKR